MMTLLPQIARTLADKQHRYAIGSTLWGALCPAAAWAHYGHTHDSDSAGPWWYGFLWPLLVFGVVFAVVWLAAIVLARRQKPRL